MRIAKPTRPIADIEAQTTAKQHKQHRHSYKFSSYCERFRLFGTQNSDSCFIKAFWRLSKGRPYAHPHQIYIGASALLSAQLPTFTCPPKAGASELSLEPQYQGQDGRQTGLNLLISRELRQFSRWFFRTASGLNPGGTLATIGSRLWTLFFNSTARPAGLAGQTGRGKKP